MIGAGEGQYASHSVELVFFRSWNGVKPTSLQLQTTSGSPKDSVDYCSGRSGLTQITSVPEHAGDHAVAGAVGPFRAATL
jgi:hypothetical protein